jgi:hypothetical protein
LTWISQPHCPSKEETGKERNRGEEKGRERESISASELESDKRKVRLYERRVDEREQRGA